VHSLVVKRSVDVVSARSTRQSAIAQNAVMCRWAEMLYTTAYRLRCFTICV